MTLDELIVVLEAIREERGGSLPVHSSRTDQPLRADLFRVQTTYRDTPQDRTIPPEKRLLLD